MFYPTLSMFPALREIKQLRERVGWSQNELARRADISQSAITKYENGSQVPSYDIAIRIFNALLEEDLRKDRAVSTIMSKEVMTAKNNSKFGEILEIMKKNAISQLPVIKKDKIIGSISETATLNIIDQYRNLSDLKEELVEFIIEEHLPTVPMSAKLKEITPLLRHYNAVLVLEKGEIMGILTKADLLDL